MYLLLCVTDVSELPSEQGGSLMPGRERRIYIKNELGKKRQIILPSKQIILLIFIVELIFLCLIKPALCF